MDEINSMVDADIVMIKHGKTNFIPMNEGDMYVSPNVVAVYLEKTIDLNPETNKVLLLMENFSIIPRIANWNSVISVYEGYAFAQVLPNREKIILHCGINSWATKETDPRKVAERLWKNAIWNRNTKVRVEFP